MSARASEQSAMTTVPPANATALPDVAQERAIDSFTSTPSSSRRRYRVMMKSE
jgi:hypothetical protein